MDRPSTAICLGPDPAGWAIDPAMLQFPEDLFSLSRQMASPPCMCDQRCMYHRDRTNLTKSGTNTSLPYSSAI